MLHKKQKCNSRTMPLCIKSINFIEPDKRNEEKHGCVSQIKPDTVNSQKGHMTSSVRNTLKKNIRL